MVTNGNYQEWPKFSKDFWQALYVNVLFSSHENGRGKRITHNIKDRHEKPVFGRLSLFML